MKIATSWSLTKSFGQEFPWPLLLLTTLLLLVVTVVPAINHLEWEKINKNVTPWYNQSTSTVRRCIGPKSLIMFSDTIIDKQKRKSTRWSTNFEHFCRMLIILRYTNNYRWMNYKNTSWLQHYCLLNDKVTKSSECTRDKYRVGLQRCWRRRSRRAVWRLEPVYQDQDGSYVMIFGVV